MTKNIETTNLQLFERIATIIETAHQKIASVVNLTMVYSYFEIGKMIIEEEQQGNIRATYGKQTLVFLSQKLTQRFGKGYSIENLDRMRFFYKTYAIQISSTPLTKFKLSWTHYLVLMRIVVFIPHQINVFVIHPQNYQLLFFCLY